MLLRLISKEHKREPLRQEEAGRSEAVKMTLVSPLNQALLHKEQVGWPNIKTPRSKKAFF